MSAEPTTMRDVVRDLLTKGAEALLELQDFRQAIADVLRNLAELALATRGLCLDVGRAPVPEDTKEPTALRAVRERTAFVNTLTQQVLDAFRQIETEIQGWGLDGDEDETPTLTLTLKH